MTAASCRDVEQAETRSDTGGSMVKLVVLDPGHYHAALVQKSMYEQVEPVVHVYAPNGPDVQDYLEQIERFNSPEQYEKVTGLPDFPDFLADRLNDKGVLPCYSNGEMVYGMKGVFVKLSVSWQFEAPDGVGDTHHSLFRGSKTHVVIYQGREQNYQPEVYVEPAPGADAEAVATSLKKTVNGLQGKFPGLWAEMQQGDSWHILIPEKYRIGHDAHFRKVMEAYLQYLADGRLPDWEVPNMLAKYYITTRALEMAR